MADNNTEGIFEKLGIILGVADGVVEGNALVGLADNNTAEGIFETLGIILGVADGVVEGNALIVVEGELDGVEVRIWDGV